MKILVAGGAGYLGTTLVPELIKHGHQVDVVDLFWFGDFLPKEIKKIKKDINQLKANEVEGYDVIVFLAGLSNDPMADFAPGLCFYHNLSVPIYLAYLAKKAGVKKYVMASSCSVYGNAGQMSLTEEAIAKADYPYGMSKYQAEKAVENMQTNDFRVLIFRKATLSGFSPRLRLDLLVNTMTMNAMLKGSFFVNNPKIYRPLLSVRDAARAYRMGIENDKVSGVYNLAGESFTIGEVGERVLCKLHDCGYKVNMDVFEKEEIRNYHVSTEKLQRELAFRANDSIEDMIQSLLDHKDFIESFGWGADIFQNIKVFKKIIV